MKATPKQPECAGEARCRSLVYGVNRGVSAQNASLDFVQSIGGPIARLIRPW
jgi:hypothetical protein